MDDVLRERRRGGKLIYEVILINTVYIGAECDDVAALLKFIHWNREAIEMEFPSDIALEQYYAENEPPHTGMAFDSWEEAVAWLEN